MQRSGAATRRFYAAFYHWTLRSANPSRRCAGTTATLVTRRKQNKAHGPGGSAQPLALSQSENVGTSEQLRKEAVQSTADRPTESLDLWEHAVRDKSEKSVTVELLVPRRVLRSKEIANRARIHEVKLSTPGLREDAGDDEPCAVILEGDYTDVKAVWKNIFYHRSEQTSNGSMATKQTTHADVEPIAHRIRQDFAREQQQNFVEKECSLPESFWQPIGKEGTVEYLQTQFGLHVDMLDEVGPLQYARLKGSQRQVREVDRFLEDIRNWELERSHRKNSGDNTAKEQVQIVRRNDLPSENLEVWQCVTRKQLQGETEIEICLPERAWQQIRRNGGAENLHARFAMEFEPLEVAQDGKTRCLVFKGDVAYADRAKSYLEGFRVNVPELQEDEEYLKIHSAATGLPMTTSRDQRQFAPRSSEKIDSNERAAQTPSEKSRRRPAAQENKSLSSIHDRGRLAIPEHIRQELEASNESTLAQIQQDSGVEAVLCLETAESRQYLKIIGSQDACKKARALLQKSIVDDNERTGRSNPGVNELARSISLVFSVPSPTHVAWVHIPEGTRLRTKDRRDRLHYETDTRFRWRETAGGKLLLKIIGPSAPVKLAMANIQRFIDEERKATSKPAAKLEVLKMGSIQDVGEESPVELSAKAAKLEQQTLSESTVKASEPEEQTEDVSMHFAWLKVPKTYSHSEFAVRARAINYEHNCFISQQKKVTEEEVIVWLSGSEEALSHGIKALQRMSDEGCKDNGKSPVKLEIVSTGLYDDMPDSAAVIQSILTGAPAISKDQASESTEQPAMPISEVSHVERRDHFAWIKIQHDESAGQSVRHILQRTIAKAGCRMSSPRIVRREAGEIQGLLRILGSEDMIKSAVEALQQRLADGTRETSGKPAGTVEMIQMGLKKDMVDYDTFLQSIKDGASAVSAKQPASIPQQTLSESGAAEQAEQVSSSSTTGKTTKQATVDRANVPLARKAEEQATKQSNQQLSDDMRSALRYITQPVALVTSFVHEGHSLRGVEAHKHARGVTVSSFCTVTLQPIPVVSFNLRVPSRSWDAISSSGYFRVHLLKASPEGAAAAHAFTLPYEQPHRPFEHLSQGDATTLYPNTKGPSKTPQIKWDQAIHASFVAKVMPEKCVQVGDHMIVVAEVVKTSLSEGVGASDAGALAYGMRGYRALGGEIKPMEIKRAERAPSKTRPAKELKSVGNAPDKVSKTAEQESVSDHVKPGEKAPKKVEPAVSAVNEIAESSEQDSAVGQLQSDENAPDNIATEDMPDLYARFAADPDEEDFEATPAPAPKNIEDLGPSSPMLDEESLRQVLEENESAYSSLGLPSQTAAENPALAEALSAVAGAYNEAPEPESTSQKPAPLVDQPADPAAPSQPEPTPQTEPPSNAHPVKSATREERPASALSTGKRPWGMSETMTQQIRKLSIYHTPRRHYSTNNNDSSSSSPQNPPPPPHPPLSKQLLKTTVADYLTRIPTHRKRYTSLIALHNRAQTLEALLTNPSPTLSPSELASLTDEAATTRRKVSRELALRNAQDLRAMLDEGRVAAAQAQWLESNLEQGQVVLLEEARVLRRELEEGRLGVGEFERRKGVLMGDYEGLEGVLMRLREFEEDDGEEGDGQDGEGEVGEGVDGGGKEGGRG